MKTFLTLTLAFLLTTSLLAQKSDGWISLFDGKSLAGWKVSEHPATFTVANGTIIAFGDRAHLFYDGAVMNHNFKNFEFKAEVMTTPGSNSGIFIHTVYQEDGWPSKGYEIQVNNTHTDWRKTGSVYAVQDVKEAPAKDDEHHRGSAGHRRSHRPVGSAGHEHAGRAVHRPRLRRRRWRDARREDRRSARPREPFRHHATLAAREGDALMCRTRKCPSPYRDLLADAAEAPILSARTLSCHRTRCEFLPGKKEQRRERGVGEQHREQRPHDRTRRRVTHAFRAALDREAHVARDGDDEPRKDDAFDKAGVEIEGVRKFERAQHVCGGGKIERVVADGPSAGHAHAVSKHRERRQHDEHREKAGDDEEADGIDRHDFERLDFLGDFHRAEFRRDRRAAAPDDDDGDDERAEFAQQREGDEVRHEADAPHFAQRARALHGHGEADAEGGERGHGQRADADHDHLVKDFADLKRLAAKGREERPVKDLAVEREVLFHAPGGAMSAARASARVGKIERNSLSRTRSKMVCTRALTLTRAKLPPKACALRTYSMSVARPEEST